LIPSKPKLLYIPFMSELSSLHNHGPGGCSVSDSLHRADAMCRIKGIRLTDQRRAVLEVLAAAQKPMGAYDLIEPLRARLGRLLAPTAIYRALDFLKTHGFIHKLESLNAFIACLHSHHGHERIVFLMCETCGKVDEATDAALDHAILRLAQANGFRARQQVMEIVGHCALCLPAQNSSHQDQSHQEQSHKDQPCPEQFCGAP
jgi:Fur family transcriptional regulator, zinc uptake regulator